MTSKSNLCQAVITDPERKVELTATAPEPDIDGYESFGSLPEWYSDVALLPPNDEFYQVEDSDFLENDWLNLYAEVTMYALQEGDNKSLFLSWLPLKIKKVVVQTFEDVKAKEKLKARNAIFYIRFRNLKAPPHGMCKDHRVIVRRSTDGIPGHICLDIKSCTDRNIFKGNSVWTYMLSRLNNYLLCFS